MFLKSLVLLGLSDFIIGKRANEDLSPENVDNWSTWNAISYCTEGSYVEGSNRKVTEAEADYLAYKWKLLFSWFDSDGDKMFSLADINVARRQLGKLQHLQVKELKRMLKEYKLWGKEYILWGRSSITEEDFVYLQMELYNSDKLKFYNRMKSLCKTATDLTDYNRDGFETLEEHLNFFWAAGHKSLGENIDLFKNYRPDDGKLPAEVDINVWVKYLTCEDRSIPDLVKEAFESGL